MIAGYVIIYDCHMVLTSHGLALTMHSIVGYMTIALVLLTYLMGFTMYVMKWGGSLRRELKPLHKRMGMVSLMMGYMTILMGFTEKANGFATQEGSMGTLVFAQVIIGLVVATSIFVTFSVIKFADKKDAEKGDYKEIPSNAEDHTVGCFSGCNVLRMDAAAANEASVKAPLIT